MPQTEDLNAVRAVAQEIAGTPAWGDFAAYCDLRGQGLRKPAHAALDRFLEATRGWSFDERRAFTTWLAETSARVFAKAVLMPQPLLERLVRPTLEEWVDLKPSEAEPLVLLGELLGAGRVGEMPEHHYRRALRAEPDHQRARAALAEVLIGRVEFSQHHLPDFYIGEPDGDLALLDEVDTLIGGPSEIAAFLRAAAEHWRDHGRAPEGTPPRTHTVYYQP